MLVKVRLRRSIRGCLVQLQPLVAAPPDAPPPLVRYHYVKGATNADFLPGVTRLKKYNVANAALLAEAEREKSAQPRTAMSAEELTPHANALGMVALPKADAASVEAVNWPKSHVVKGHSSVPQRDRSAGTPRGRCAAAALPCAAAGSTPAGTLIGYPHSGSMKTANAARLTPATLTPRTACGVA